MLAHDAEAFQVGSGEPPVSVEQLCNKCEEVFSLIWDQEGTNDYLPDVSYPFAHIQMHRDMLSCRLCTCFSRSINCRGMAGPQNRAYVHVSRFSERSAAGQIVLRWRNAEGDIHTCILHVSRGELVPTTAETTDHELTWSRVRHWMAICRSISDGRQPEKSRWPQYRHVQCHQPTLSGSLPLRLIYVSDDNSGLRLCESEHFKNEVQPLAYTTLTHCWGTGVLPTRTLTTNLQERLKSIPFETLTKTFQDAVIITRRLGFRFLWVDSLCIVQDSVSDWSTELAKMGSIYAGCALNIVAADAANGSVGCLFDSDPALDLDLGFSIIQPQISPSREKPVVWTCIQQMSRFDFITSTRAWCFQETYLSPRSVYFGRNQLVWECRCMRGQETQPYDMHLSSAFLYGVRWNSTQILKGQIRHEANSMLDWTELIEQFSRGRLTYWKDKLISVSGIARTFHKEYIASILSDLPASSQQYMAGMWNWNLERQLFWFTTGLVEARPGQPNAPSWSWASVDCSVRFWPSWMEFEVNFQIKHAQVELCTEDEYGTVKGGLLVLECNPLIPATATEADISGPKITVSGIALNTKRASLDEPLSNPKVFILFGATGTTELDPSWYRMWGLLLQKTSDENKFRRIGCFDILKSVWESDEAMRELLPFQGMTNNKIVISII